MTKCFEVEALSRKTILYTYNDLKQYICSLPNHYGVCEITIFDDTTNKKLLSVFGYIQEMLELLECKK